MDKRSKDLDLETLIQKAFLEAGKYAFLGAGSAPIASFAAKNNCLPAPTNPFPGADHPLTRLWKYICRGE
jgi:hypothetical protein